MSTPDPESSTGTNAVDGRDPTPPGTGSAPTSAPTSALTSTYDDEVSLRDLYLIVRRGMPTIVVTTIVVALAAFLVTSLGSDAFEATSTVLATPTVVRPSDATAQSTSLEGEVRVDFETYASIARSTRVLDAVRARVTTEADGGPAPEEVERAFALTRVSTSNAASLTVAHTVTWSDPTVARALADTWTDVTVDAVREALVASLRPSLDQASAAMEAYSTMTAALDAAQTAFEVEDVAGMEEALVAVNARALRVDDELDVVERSIVRARAVIDELTQRLVPPSDAGAPIDPAIVDLLVRQGIVDEDVATDLRIASAVAGDRAAAPDSASAAVVTTIDTVALLTLQRTRADLAALLAEQEQLVASLDTAASRAEALRTDLARLRSTASDLARQRAEIERSLGGIAALEPQLSFLVASAPNDVRVLAQAGESLRPVDDRAPLTTAVAGVVAALCATLFVFLREAVKEPSART